MVVTRNNNSEKNYHANSKMKNYFGIPELRPRNNTTNYREESPDDFLCRQRFIKVNVKRKSLHCNMRVRNNSTRQNAINVIHKYKLRKSNQIKNSKHFRNEISPENSNDSKSDKFHKYDPNDNNNTLSSKNNGDSNNSFPSRNLKNIDANISPKSFYGSNRRYPMRLRRQPTEMYIVNRNYKSKKSLWNTSLLSPELDSSLPNRHHIRHLNLHRKHQSDDTDDSDNDKDVDLIQDELKFERRRLRSLIRARSELKPININTNDIQPSDVIPDRSNASRCNFADIEPMFIDKSITFQSIGGNKHCIQALKESVILPLIYPEVFQKLSINPPRGLLFYGPPGSGKTLIARALVNECNGIVSSERHQRVAFFMRKGADCLSKWVGESERQLRLLFDQAYKMRPSIIFFDEIDGLAPVRSSRQDQIHSSIVSTLLSLIDGLDDRGEIIVIGATNRLDAIDPALRRPGRFDREFLFTLPDKSVRREIVDIHTKNIQPSLTDQQIEYLANATNGYSGADIKALVVEAGLCSLRRRYPQIYQHQPQNTGSKLQLNLDNIKILPVDIDCAVQLIRPSNRRSVNTAIQLQQLPHRLCVLLHRQIDMLHELLIGFNQSDSSDNKHQPITSGYNTFVGLSKSDKQNQYFSSDKLMLYGYAVDDIVSSVLFNIPAVYVFQLDCISLNHNPLSSHEERLCHFFHDMERHVSPSLLYIPHIDMLYSSLDLPAQHIIYNKLRMMRSGSSNFQHRSIILVTLSTGNCDWSDCLKLDNHKSIEIWNQLASMFKHNSHRLPEPTNDELEDYFTCLAEDAIECNATYVDPMNNENECTLEELPVIPSKPKVLSTAELIKLEAEEEIVIRRFRMSLRKILSMLARERKFQIFINPVEEDEAPNYFNIITNPMDLSTMRNNIDLNEYLNLDSFKRDLHLISTNALLYNPPRTTYLKDIRRHAYDFIDSALSYIEEHISPEMEHHLNQINTARVNRTNINIPTDTSNNDIYRKSSTPINTDISQDSIKEDPGRLRSSLHVLPRNFHSDSELGKRLRSSSSSSNINEQDSLSPASDIVFSGRTKKTAKMRKNSINFGDVIKSMIGPLPTTTVKSTQQVATVSPNICSTSYGNPSLSNIDLRNQLKPIWKYAVNKSRGYSLDLLEQLYTNLLKSIHLWNNNVLPPNNKIMLASTLLKCIENFNKSQ